MGRILENGYEMETTFEMDFQIAEMFGAEGVKDTFRRAFKEWKSNYIYLTELVMVLNWNLFKHYENGNMELAKVYDALWRKADDYACTHLKGTELSFFLRTTD